MEKTKISKELLENIIIDCFSIADVCRKLKLKPQGSNYRTIKKYIKDFNLDISHFLGQKSNICNRNNKHNEKEVDSYLVKDSYVSLKNLKLKLISDGIKKYKCEICGCNKWNDKQISLQLHHINGDNTDNRLENLMLLCPNCHSQTDNFCGSKNKCKTTKIYCKNCGKEITNSKIGFCDECYELLINDALDKKLVNKTSNIRKVIDSCKECGSEIYFKNKYGLCKKCYDEIINRKIKNRPNKEELISLIKKNGFRKVGKMYNVSDNTIRKWCIAYDLPIKKNEIINFTL